MTTNYPEKGKKPNKRLQPFCLEQSTKKKRLSTSIKGPLIVLTVITILIIPMIPVEDDAGVITILQQKTPEIAWFADFEESNDLDEWDQTSYRINTTTTIFTNSSDPRFSVVEGELTTPVSQISDNKVSTAFHDSNVAYGTWSFDWSVGPGGINEKKA